MSNPAESADYLPAIWLAVNLPYGDTTRFPLLYFSVFGYLHFASDVDASAKVVVTARFSRLTTWHGLADRDDSDKPDLAISFLYSFGRYASP